MECSGRGIASINGERLACPGALWPGAWETPPWMGWDWTGDGSLIGQVRSCIAGYFCFWLILLYISPAADFEHCLLPATHHLLIPTTSTYIITISSIIACVSLLHQAAANCLASSPTASSPSQYPGPANQRHHATHQGKKSATKQHTSQPPNRKGNPAPSALEPEKCLGRALPLIEAFCNTRRTMR